MPEELPGGGLVFLIADDEGALFFLETVVVLLVLKLAGGWLIDDDDEGPGFIWESVFSLLYLNNLDVELNDAELVPRFRGFGLAFWVTLTV